MISLKIENILKIIIHIAKFETPGLYVSKDAVYLNVGWSGLE